MIYSFTRVLFVTLFAGRKIDKTLIVTVQTMVNLKSVSSHCATKYRTVSYCKLHIKVYGILRNLLFFAMDITKPEPNKSFRALRNETIGPGEKVVLTSSFILRRYILSRTILLKLLRIR